MSRLTEQCHLIATDFLNHLECCFDPCNALIGRPPIKTITTLVESNDKWNDPNRLEMEFEKLFDLTMRWSRIGVQRQVEEEMSKYVREMSRQIPYQKGKLVTVIVSQIPKPYQLIYLI
jgi:hypothetical protein